MARPPRPLTLGTNRDRREWWQTPWLRRGLLCVPTAVVVLALFNVFGQRPDTTTARGAAATLVVSAPLHVRSGLVYAARLRIDARRSLRKATIVLDPGWAEGYTVNGLAPQPLTEGSNDGKLVFGFGHVPAGKELSFWISLQVNPTNLGRRNQDVALYDGSTLLTRVDRTITIFP